VSGKTQRPKVVVVKNIVWKFTEEEIGQCKTQKVSSRASREENPRTHENNHIREKLNHSTKSHTK